MNRLNDTPIATESTTQASDYSCQVYLYNKVLFRLEIPTSKLSFSLKTVLNYIYSYLQI